MERRKNEKLLWRWRFECNLRPGIYRSCNILYTACNQSTGRFIWNLKSNCLAGYPSLQSSRTFKNVDCIRSALVKIFF